MRCGSSSLALLLLLLLPAFIVNGFSLSNNSPCRRRISYSSSSSSSPLRMLSSSPTIFPFQRRSSPFFLVVKQQQPCRSITTTRRGRQRQKIRVNNVGNHMTTTTGDNDENSSLISFSNKTTTTIKTSISTMLQKWRAPLLTILAALVGISPWTTSLVVNNTIGHLRTMQVALGILMLSMGLSITIKEVKDVIENQPGILVLNMLCCFGLMPFLALQLSTILGLSPEQTIGTIVLGSVSGGQASNLFAMLAGGNVALSIICTLSTTLAGVVITPLLIQGILGRAVPVQAWSMLQSVATLVLIPLVTGLILNRFLQDQQSSTMMKHCNIPTIRLGPTLGLAATMILVAGGAANAASTLNSGGQSGLLLSSIGVSILLPLLGGAAALGLACWLLPSNNNNINNDINDNEREQSKRTLVIEVLSKSPTLAHVLVLKHFGVAAACIPAAAMVSLAVLGALVASTWQCIHPISSSLSSSTTTKLIVTTKHS